MIKVDEVVKMTTVSRGTIYKLARESKIPHYKFGNSIRFDKLAIIRFILASGSSVPNTTLACDHHGYFEEFDKNNKIDIVNNTPDKNGVLWPNKEK